MWASYISSVWFVSLSHLHGLSWSISKKGIVVINNNRTKLIFGPQSLQVECFQSQKCQMLYWSFRLVLVNFMFTWLMEQWGDLFLMTWLWFTTPTAHPPAQKKKKTASLPYQTCILNDIASIFYIHWKDGRDYPDCIFLRRANLVSHLYVLLYIQLVGTVVPRYWIPSNLYALEF